LRKGKSYYFEAFLLRLRVFRQIASYSGFDGNARGIVIPSYGSILVILQGGKDLHVQSNNSTISCHPLAKQDQFDAAKKATNPAETNQHFNDGSWRIFRIEAQAPVRSDAGVIVEAVEWDAKNQRELKVWDKLRVGVVAKRTVKVAIRPVQVRDGTNVVRFCNAADPQKLLDEMNGIWNSQANVYFELGRTDPATIDGLSPQAGPIEFQKLPEGFLRERDQNSKLTFFLVRKVNDGKEPCYGVTDPKAGLSLIADERLDSTMAHEVGHYVGSVDEKGNYVGRYSDPDSQEHLMNEEHTGKKIPFTAMDRLHHTHPSKK
jgi:antitoxin component of MazEF toxin-antitoxin module